jgi:hypothetical protein
MDRADRRASGTPAARRTDWKIAGLTGLGALALGLTMSLPAQPAQAQFLRWWWWHRDEGPPPIPPGNVGNGPAHWRDAVPGPAPAPHPVSIAEIRRRTGGLGLRLLGAPHRQGRVYVAFGEDAQGMLHHLTFDAYEGTLIENQTSPIKAKAVPTKPLAKPVETRAVEAPPHPTPIAKRPAATPNPASTVTAARTPPASTTARTTARAASSDPTPLVKTPPAPTSPAQPSAARTPPAKTGALDSSTQTARDLSPIRPQPGAHDATPQDSNIDKD